MNKLETSEVVQRMAAKLLATNPAGEGLCLIGGFRYRLLDNSCRISADLDYHWGADLAQKQKQVIALLQKILLPQIKSDLDYDGTARAANGPDADSAMAKTIDLVIYQEDASDSRIGIPIDITSIVCLDKPIVRTADGVVYLSVSDADMVESKVLTLINRIYPAQRDLIDIFLFHDKFAANSGERLRNKLKMMSLDKITVRQGLEHIQADRQRHCRTIDEIVKEQMDRQAALNIRQTGGGAMIFDRVMDILKNLLTG